MIVGIPKEVKPQECRVALLPAGTAALAERGHGVVMQRDAGAGAGFDNREFAAAGAEIAADAAEVYRRADLILKVKEPLSEEFERFREGQALFCYIHSETRPELLDMLLRKRITGLAFENVRSPDGDRPLLKPMSIIAGQQSVLQGMQFLYNHRGGTGTSLVTFPGLTPARVVVLGAGHAGMAATRVAAALGAHVELFESDVDRIHERVRQLPPNVSICHSGTVSIREAALQADLVVHATTIPPNSKTKLIDRDTVRGMRPGSVIVDITANLNGAIETVDRYTTHQDPVYTVDGVIHYVVSNIPGTVARTSSQALAMATAPYVDALTDKGIRAALRTDSGLLASLTCIDGILTWHEAGDMLDRPWRPPADVIGD